MYPFGNEASCYGEELLAPHPAPCRLSSTAYSIYSQLPSMSGGRSSIRNLSSRRAVTDPFIVGSFTLFIYLYIQAFIFIVLLVNLSPSTKTQVVWLYSGCFHFESQLERRLRSGKPWFSSVQPNSGWAPGLTRQGI